MNRPIDSVSTLIGVDAAKMVARKAFLEFTEADAALWIIASGYRQMLAAQDRPSRNNRSSWP